MKHLVAPLFAAALFQLGGAHGAALTGAYTVVESYTVTLTYAADASRVYQGALTNIFQITNNNWQASNLTTAAIAPAETARTLANAAGHYSIEAGTFVKYFQGSNAPIAAVVPLGFYFIPIPFDGDASQYDWAHPGLITLNGNSATNLSGVSTYSHGYYSGSGLPDVLLVVTSTVAISPAAAGPSVTFPAQNLTTNGGASVTFTATAGGAPPLAYRWFKDAIALTNATNASLTLTNLHRADGGAYTITVSNSAGSASGGPAQLTVRVPQRLQPPQTIAGGSVRLLFGDADGMPFPPGIAANFQVQTVTNLASTNWTPLTNTLTWTNGALFIDDSVLVPPWRSYRVIEN